MALPGAACRLGCRAGGVKGLGGARWSMDACKDGCSASSQQLAVHQDLHAAASSVPVTSASANHLLAAIIHTHSAFCHTLPPHLAAHLSAHLMAAPVPLALLPYNTLLTT